MGLLYWFRVCVARAIVVNLQNLPNTSDKRTAGGTDKRPN
jgi:hypothetical protein